VSVVGFDDIPLAPFFPPPLTTIRLPAFELGRVAGEALLERIAGRAPVERTLLSTELIVRASTAPPSTPSPALRRRVPPVHETVRSRTVDRERS
jgi:DNA-binding LacI/PurR family transcriptional regulator